jgi:hypothetical protein
VAFAPLEAIEKVVPAPLSSHVAFTVICRRPMFSEDIDEVSIMMDVAIVVFT